MKFSSLKNTSVYSFLSALEFASNKPTMEKYFEIFDDPLSMTIGMMLKRDMTDFVDCVSYSSMFFFVKEFLHTFGNPATFN